MPTTLRRMTKQRQAIINMLASSDAHPTAEMVYDAVRREVPDISLATVYRNLQLLVAQGKVREIRHGRDGSRFDSHMEPHSHFFCQSCGRVYDMPAYAVRPPADWLNLIPGKLLGQRTDFFGVCRHCLNNDQLKGENINDNTAEKADIAENINK